MTNDSKHIKLDAAFAQLQSPADVRAFLVDLCTPAELRAISERWHVAQILDKGEKSYREIHALTGVSTTTIGRVARFLREEPNGGYRAVLGKKDES